MIMQGRTTRLLDYAMWAFHAAPKGRVIDYRHSVKARRAWGKTLSERGNR